MFNVIMNALAKGFFRAFICFCIWFLGYLIWKLMNSKKVGVIRPLWLDIVIAAAIAGLIGAIVGMKFHRIDYVVTPIVFIIGAWIAWSGWKKRKSAMEKKSVPQKTSSEAADANPFRRNQG